MSRGFHDLGAMEIGEIKGSPTSTEASDFDNDRSACDLGKRPNLRYQGISKEEDFGERLNM